MMRSRGFSLIELMISVALGLAITAAVVSVFLGSRKSYLTTSGSSALADNARFSTDFMNRALRSTGFIGCTGAPSVLTTAPPPNVLFDFGNTVSGYEAVNTGNGQTIDLRNLPSPLTGDSSAGDWTQGGAVNLPNNFSLLVNGATTTNGLVGTTPGTAVKYSDVLVVHSTLQPASGNTSPPTAVTAFSTDYLTLASMTGMPSATTNWVAVVSDCSKAVVFTVSSVNSNSNYLYYDAVTPSSTIQGNSGSNLPVSFDYAQVYLPTTSIYYIGAGSDGDGALFRGDLALQSGGGYVLQANEIVPDVENMQVLYGIDPGNTHAATSYVTADQAAATCPAQPSGASSFNCVVSVQVAFLVASPLGMVPQPATPASISFPNSLTIIPRADTRTRTVYQITVALRDTLP